MFVYYAGAFVYYVGVLYSCWGQCDPVYGPRPSVKKNDT